MFGWIFLDNLRAFSYLYYDTVLDVKWGTLIYNQCAWKHCWCEGIILCMHPANERWCYRVTPSLIGWVHTQSDPWVWGSNQYCFINKNCGSSDFSFMTEKTTKIFPIVVYVSLPMMPWAIPCIAGIVLWTRPANERRRYIVTPSFIGWAHS